MKEIIAFEPPETVLICFRNILKADEIEKMFDTWSTYKTPDNKYKLLVDVGELEDIPPKVRGIMRERGRNFHISKLAAFGASTKIRIMAGLIIKMIPNIGSSTFVKTEEEARTWLAEK
jgi:hypothetical protein